MSKPAFTLKFWFLSSLLSAEQFKLEEANSDDCLQVASMAPCLELQEIIEHVIIMINIYIFNYVFVLHLRLITTYNVLLWYLAFVSRCYSLLSFYNELLFR